MGQVTGQRIPWTPYLYGQRKLRNLLYLPVERDLPSGDLKLLSFQFGIQPGSTTVEVAGTAEVAQTLPRSFLVWAVTGVYINTTDPGSSFDYQIFHTHEGKQRQWFNKHQNQANAIGTAQRPFMLRSPYLFMAGDQVECEVKNRSIAGAARIEVVLIGAEVDVA